MHLCILLECCQIFITGKQFQVWMQRRLKGMLWLLHFSIRLTVYKINKLISYIWVHDMKPSVMLLLRNLRTFYGTQKFITLCAWTPLVSVVNQMHRVSLRSILMLFTNLHTGLCSGLFPSGFPTKHSLFTMPCASDHPWLGHSNYTWQKVQVMKLRVTSSIFGPNILLSILFSNTVRLCVYLNIGYYFSQLYRTTRKIRILYILIFMFLDSKWKYKMFWTEW
jgi:hypothetical protein